MRVSDIANWAACEAMALHSPPRQAGRTNVAAWVGTMAHAILAGQPVPPTERPHCLRPTDADGTRGAGTSGQYRPPRPQALGR